MSEKEVEVKAAPAVEAKPEKRNYRSKQRPKKVCYMCENKLKNLDYKEVNVMKKFVTPKGKILPRRQTGTCTKHQREVTTCVKMARQMAILPYVGE